MQEEFARQVENLLQKDYPHAAGLTKEAFLQILEPLRKKITTMDLPESDFAAGKLPFVIVVKSELVSIEKQMQLVEREGKNGIVNLTPLEPETFKPIDSLILPESKIYLLVAIDRGKETLNVRPEDAFTTIAKQKRSPLTIDEGLAIITQFPDFLKKNNCFSLLGSRCGDKRVPAIWISEGKPKLGWCWNGNPHTWLGSASAQTRY